MELLLAFVFSTILLCSSAQSPPIVASADCNDTENEAGVALDLINKHRSDGYIFSLLRVADAHVQHVGNASIFYFTLDVVETDCLVISRTHWDICRYVHLHGISDFGRCNTVLYINRQLQRERLYGYNCTMSPVPPKLYECKECPEKVTVLGNIQEYTKEANRILKRYSQDNNKTSHFKVERIMKALLVETVNYTVHHIEFTIKENTCPKFTLVSLMSGCNVPSDRKAHTGFCKGKILNGTKDLEVIEAGCEIYDIQLGRHPSHSRPHNDSEESHHHCNVCGHGCRKSCHGHHHCGHHGVCHPHHHHRPQHRGNHSQHHHHHHHSPHRHHHSPHHCHHCPHQDDHRPHHRHRGPPHGHHRHRHCHSTRPCGSAGPADHSNSSKEEIQENNHPGFPPPPGPRYPPPPPGGPHHFPPSSFPPPPAGPPPPPGQPFWPHPHPHHPEGPHFYPPPPPPHHHCCHHGHQWNNTLHGRREDSSSKDHDSFQSPHSLLEGEVASVYRLPLTSEHDVLQAPGGDFFSPSHDRYEKAVAQPFPLTPSESESCPGKPMYDLPYDLLPLYPLPPTR